MLVNQISMGRISVNTLINQGKSVRLDRQVSTRQPMVTKIGAITAVDLETVQKYSPLDFNKIPTSSGSLLLLTSACWIATSKTGIEIQIPLSRHIQKPMVLNTFQTWFSFFLAVSLPLCWACDLLLGVLFSFMFNLQSVECISNMIPQHGLVCKWKFMCSLN